jgi:Arc/MetJ-type ribon-helix-helix transcriptional regulator
MKESPPAERFEFRLALEHADRLRRLRKRTQLQSNAEVVRQALKEYESLLNKRKS